MKDRSVKQILLGGGYSGRARMERIKEGEYGQCS
jgi:hypothetical protein